MRDSPLHPQESVQVGEGRGLGRSCAPPHPQPQALLHYLCCTRLRPCNNSSWFHSYSCLQASPYTSCLTSRLLLRLLAGEILVVTGVGAGDRRPNLTLVLAYLSSRKIFES